MSVRVHMTHRDNVVVELSINAGIHLARLQDMAIRSCHVLCD